MLLIARTIPHRTRPASPPNAHSPTAASPARSKLVSTTFIFDIELARCCSSVGHVVSFDGIAEFMTLLFREMGEIGELHILWDCDDSLEIRTLRVLSS